LSGILVFLLRGMMAICLFAFVGFVIYVVWKDLRQQATAASRVKIPNLNLEVEGRTELKRISVETPEAFIGRDPGCEVHLDESTLSARHARLSYHHKQWWLEDMHSTNGSFLNEQPVLNPTVLDDGDRITCGNVTLLVHVQQVP